MTAQPPGVGLSGLQLVRNMKDGDIASIVRVHLESFPGFFLTFLGPTFLRELYGATLMDPDGIGFVAECPTGISGFVMGTAHPAGFYRRLLRQRRWRFALASTKAVIRRPSIAPRLLRAISMSEQATQHQARGTLMSIAVRPQCQGQGIGQALVGAFLEEAFHRKLRQIDLTTDRHSNDAANRFYQKLGFVCERTYETPEGRAMNAYVINVPTSHAPALEKQ